jgi:hypothetical protein
VILPLPDTHPLSAIYLFSNNMFDYLLEWCVGVNKQSPAVRSEPDGTGSVVWKRRQESELGKDRSTSASLT